MLSLDKLGKFESTLLDYKQNKIVFEEIVDEISRLDW